MWYRFAVAPRLLSNPIVSGFWVNEKEINELGEIVNKPRFIDYGEEINVRGWQSLLSNKSKINADQDSLNKFLSDDKFEIIKGKKFYVPGLSGYEPTLLKNPIKGGFWVYEKKKNELGEIVSKPLEIPYEKPLSIRDWLRLLNTSGKFINAKNINCLKEFLTDDKFEIIDGKKFYRPTSRGNPVLIRNPIDETFYIDDEPIEPSAKMNQSTWVKLLKSEIIYDNPALLKDFIINNLKRNDDGKLIYTYDPSIRSIMLQNPIAEGFYIGNDFYGPDTTMGVGAWNKLLNTGQINSNDPDSLKDFLSDKRRFRTRNNKKTYIPVKRSIREGLFSEKFYNYNHDDITVEADQYINVIANKTYYLRLDFAFKKDAKIILAVEINGEQHYGFRPFGNSKTYKNWQSGILNDILKINYCYNNNIPLLIFNHMLSLSEFKSILDNLHKNPHAYENFIPQPVIDNNPKNTSLEFIKRQIYSHLYPVFNDTITFEDDEAKKRYIKDTLILISKLMGVYENGIDKTDYIRAFDTNVDLTSNYNICLAIYNSLHPDYPLDYDEKITYSDLSKKPRIYKEKPLEKQKPEENLIPSEE